MLSKNFLKTYVSKIEKIESTQLIETFEKLSEDYSVLLTSMNELKAGIFLLDKEGVPVHINDFAKQHFVLSEIPIMKDPLVEMIPIPEFPSFLKRCMKEKPSFIREEMMSSTPKEKIWDIQFYTMETQDTELAFMVVFQDVTSDKKLQQRQILKKNITSMQHLAASLAHEIKNPLTAIQLYLTIAKRYTKDKGDPDDKITHALSIISQEVERLGALTSDFLTNIRPLSLKIVQIPAEGLINSLRELILPILIKEDIHLSVAIEEKLPSIAGDIASLRMVLLNILKNSIESFEGLRGTPKEKKISITLEENAPFVQIKVLDNGCGMDKKTLRQAFEPYVTTKKTGSGIGLSLSHKIIMEHKGDIYMESQKGKGTEVTLLLPIYKGVVHKFLS